ncbi:MAG: phenylalanine--tRNA ligase beta subunit [Candidatus Babeliales bacterium]
MKLSLAWLFDHIDADWRKIDVAHLVNRFNKMTAEIEGFEKIEIKLDTLAAAQVTKITPDRVEVYCSEWKHTIDMPWREAKEGQIYIIAKDGDKYRWASLKDFGSEKESLLPSFKISEAELSRAWKMKVDTHDYIIHLDNKSINHRPDMWGHRGVAREIAALLDMPFRALDHLLIAKNVNQTDGQQVSENNFSISVENPESCRRFAGLYFSEVGAHCSDIWMAARLAKVDSKPINAIVDATNYVMLDLGQPMHAFDADALAQKSIVVRNAKNKETIALLDGQTVELTNYDCIITDGKQPIALAGIMGGKNSGVTCKTKSIILESANFDPAVIRKTSGRIKKRSESSARFEKNLDLSGNILGIERFLKLLDDAGITYKADDQILSLGKLPTAKTITIEHEYIEKLLGVSLAPAFISATLQELEFGVSEKNGTYTIIVPSFRATKDIGIKQDIVEEIGRLYGYDNVDEQLPKRATKPFNTAPVMRMRKIKQLLASGFNMRELYTYAFFDETFLNEINWQPGHTLKVQEAVSENWQRLVTTLIPNLLKAVHVHAQEYEQMNFFEWAKIWSEGTAASEKACLAGIFVNQKQNINFYDAKNQINKIAQLLGVSFDWVKADAKDLQPWYLPYETAYIVHQGTKIGVAGKINPAFFSKIALGDAFIFELDASFLATVYVPYKRFAPISKYPAITRDVSFLIALTATIKNLEKEIAALDSHITQVNLVDHFQKSEWQDQKSITLRITMQDPNATLESSQADAIMKKVTAHLDKQGAVIR